GCLLALLAPDCVGTLLGRGPLPARQVDQQARDGDPAPLAAHHARTGSGAAFGVSDDAVPVEIGPGRELVAVGHGALLFGMVSPALLVVVVVDDAATVLRHRRGVHQVWGTCRVEARDRGLAVGSGAGSAGVRSLRVVEPLDRVVVAADDLVQVQCDHPGRPVLAVDAALDGVAGPCLPAVGGEDTFMERTPG